MLAVRPHRAIARNVRKSRGFTLLELIVVLLILGVLAAIAIPTFNQIQKNSVQGALETTANAIAKNANAIAASNGVTEAAIVTVGNLQKAVDEAVGEAPSGNWEDTTAAADAGNGPTVTIVNKSGSITCSVAIVVDPNRSTNSQGFVWVDMETLGGDCAP